MKQIKFFFSVLLLICCSSAYSQNLSNKGKEFWVGYGHHQFHESGDNSQQMVIYLSAEQAATVTISINGTTYAQTINVPANSVVSSAPIPKTGLDDARLYNASNNSEGIFDRGIRIVSNVPIVAYSHIYGSASSGATMLMPIDTWGYTYTSLNSKQSYASNCFSWTYVIAKENNTKVEIVPSKLTRGGKAAGVPFQVTLNKGQIYQVLGAIETGGNGYEMTGTTVKSIANSAGECYPIAVFSGSSRTSNPYSCGSGGGDNDMQQLFPKQAWGMRYLIAPLSVSTSPATAQSNIYKIITSEPGTTVYRNGIPLAPPAPGEPYIIETASNMYITATKPIMVAQFMSGGSNCIGGGVGDPEMIYLSPIEQGIKRIGFYRNTLQNITVNYLTMIIPTNGMTSLVVDGFTQSSFTLANGFHTYAHPNLVGYSVLVKRWTAAQAQCIVQSDSAFTAVTYGLGSVESYGYNAGTLINNLNVIGSIRNTLDPSTSVTQHPFTCKNAPFNLSIMISYQPTSMIWQLSQVPGLSPNTNVTVNNPVPTQVVNINGNTYYQYSLPGTYSLSDTGTFTIPIRNFSPILENCNQSEVVSFTITSKLAPLTDFTYSHTGCVSDSVTFTSVTSSSNGYTILDWKWNYADATTASGLTVKKLFTTPGSQTINLKIITQEGCIGDTTRTINIFNKPQTVIGATPLSFCVGGTASFTDTSSYQGSAPINGWYWDFGNGTTSTTNNNPQTITFNTPGAYTVKHVVKVSNTCISDTATKVINVYAKPVPSFTYPAGCLPANGVVTFNNTTTVADGQTMTYSWTFGDPGSTPTNPNTSTAQSPSHTYTNYGTYPVTLSVTTANGCTKDTLVNAVLNVRPTLSFTPLTSICENTTGTISVANGTVTNGVQGTGIYTGPGTSAAGVFSPSAAGPGTHTIWYKFTSSAGCTDSLPQTIQVYAAPKPSFTFGSGCLPINGQIQFTNNTTIADAQVLTWDWNFGDVNATPGNPNTSTVDNPTHNYSSPGNYTIKLTATSSNGCVKDTTVVTTLNITPDLAYPALSAICENATSVSVATATVTNNIAGTGVYSGNGVSSNGTFNPAAAGPGTHTITYIFTAAGGCADTATQTIQVYARPKPAFTSTSGCLPINGQVQFTNNTTIADGQTMTYSWFFDDNNATPGNPNTSTAQNPTHNYSNSSSHNVKLTVTSSNGCVSDTTITRVYSVTPDVSYPALNSICENLAPVSIATGVVNNGVTGTAVYSGPGTTAAGVFNPATAGTGTHTISYIFTNAAGCADTATQTVTVLPKPLSSFTVNNNICLDATATITDGSTIPSGSITTWNWNFGNNTTASNTNGNPFTIGYTTANTYTIRLVTVGSNGCISDTTSRQVNVRPLPVVNFSLPTGICMPNGTGVFTNSTTISDNSTLSYQWTFGDGGVSTSTSPSHTYATTMGPVDVTLVATSPFGCTADTTKTLTAFYEKPVASFDVSPDTLCQGVTNTFTNTSFAPNSTVTEWSWNFGDGSTAQSENPTKRYSQPGNFAVSLTVKNAAGCVSDPFRDTVIVYLQPKIDAGPSFVVMQGTSITFRPQVNSTSGVTFTWTPSADFSNPNTLYPSIVATKNATYTLTAVGQGNCSATDTMTVKILKPINVPNAFSPNGDGVNDTWLIPNLIEYPGCVVEVFNRYGQMVYQSIGYGKPWDGTYNGTPLPFATYYYIITPKNGLNPINGSVTIVR